MDIGLYGKQNFKVVSKIPTSGVRVLNNLHLTAGKWNNGLSLLWLGYNI